MSITKIFLHAKHWQLFIIMVALPMLFQIGFMVVTFMNIMNGAHSDVFMAMMVMDTMDMTNADFFMDFSYFKFFPIVMVIYIGIFFGWFWSIAIGLQNRIPENITMKVTRFKIFFFIPIIYLLAVSVIMGSVFGGMIEMMKSNEPPNLIFVASMFAIIFPLHLFSMFCIIYVLYFTSKTIKTVELQRKVVFEDFIAEFFLLWFYPIGLWIIQPKINAIVQSANTKPSDL